MDIWRISIWRVKTESFITHKFPQLFGADFVWFMDHNADTHRNYAWIKVKDRWLSD